MQYYIISEKDIPQVKPLMPMATDYRLGHKTADWIMGFNSCRQEFMSKARVIDEEGIVKALTHLIKRGMAVPDDASDEFCEGFIKQEVDKTMSAICKFVEKG